VQLEPEAGAGGKEAAVEQVLGPERAKSAGVPTLGLILTEEIVSD